MTIEAFLERLATSPREWEIGPAGQIRRFGWGLVADPITGSGGQWDAVWNIAYSNDYAETLGLQRDVAVSIMRASDNLPGHDPDLRQRLLIACGVTEIDRVVQANPASMIAEPKGVQ